MKNIALILMDQIRTDMLGCYGHKVVKTPNIDALAMDGLTFDRAYTPSSVCTPARTSLFTGQMPTNHGVVRNPEKGGSGDPKPGAPNISTALTGYNKIYTGKWHVGSEVLPRDFGFSGHNFDGYGYPGSGTYKGMVFDQGPKSEDRYDLWLREKGYEKPYITEGYFGENPNLRVQELCGKLNCPKEATLPYFVVDEAISSIRKGKSEGKPFFIWMNFWGPHTPCVIPEPFYSMYKPEEVELDESFYNPLQGKPKHYENIAKMWGVWDASEEAWKKIITSFWGYISLIDEALGVFIDFLKAEGLYDDMLMVLTADHGDAMGAHRMIEKGEFMFESTYRIPLIVKDPQMEERGRRDDRFVYLHDLTPAIGDFAGTAPNNEFDGRSLLDITRNKKSEWRDGVLAQLAGHFVSFEQRMWREEKYKLVFNASDMCELYHMKDDPMELENLFYNSEYNSVKRELLKKICREMKAVNDPLTGWLERIIDTL